MRKRILCFLIGMVFMFSFAGSSNASLIDRGGGMIYDDDFDITWFADANYAQTSGYDADGRMNWDSAMAWADSLVFGGYDDWRLPATLQPDPSCNGQSGGDSYDTNCTGSEMGHLFYDELGGTAGSSILASGDPDLALFSNIQSGVYWSGTMYATNPLYSWGFIFGIGYQGRGGEGYDFSVWAVRDGDVAAPVPEPGTLLLLSFALAGLIVYRKKTGRYIG